MSGLKFGWKRKAGSQVGKTSQQIFQVDNKDEESTEQEGQDWFLPGPESKKKLISLEDAETKANRLKTDGCVLAEAERYWEAIKKWDEALQFSPHNEKIMDMKAQAFLSLNEVIPAVETAQSVTSLAPTWWAGHQTLGRAQLGIGEVHLALRSFCRAIHLNPTDQELWEEDLLWCRSLLERRTAALQAAASEESGQAEISETSSDSENVPPESVGDSQNSMNQTERCVRRMPENYVHMRDPT